MPPCRRKKWPERPQQNCVPASSLPRACIASMVPHAPHVRPRSPARPRNCFHPPGHCSRPHPRMSHAPRQPTCSYERENFCISPRNCEYDADREFCPYNYKNKSYDDPECHGPCIEDDNESAGPPPKEPARVFIREEYPTLPPTCYKPVPPSCARIPTAQPGQASACCYASNKTQTDSCCDDDDILGECLANCSFVPIRNLKSCVYDPAPCIPSPCVPPPYVPPLCAPPPCVPPTPPPCVPPPCVPPPCAPPPCVPPPCAPPPCVPPPCAPPPCAPPPCVSPPCVQQPCIAKPYCMKDKISQSKNLRLSVSFGTGRPSNGMLVPEPPNCCEFKDCCDKQVDTEAEHVYYTTTIFGKEADKTNCECATATSNNETCSKSFPFELNKATSSSHLNKKRGSQVEDKTCQCEDLSKCACSPRCASTSADDKKGSNKCACSSGSAEVDDETKAKKGSHKCACSSGSGEVKEKKSFCSFLTRKGSNKCACSSGSAEDYDEMKDKKKHDKKHGKVVCKCSIQCDMDCANTPKRKKFSFFHGRSHDHNQKADDTVAAACSCQCHYPPAFNQHGCTGKFSGNCNCCTKHDQSKL